jgi:hypothetical protein
MATGFSALTRLLLCVAIAQIPRSWPAIAQEAGVEPAETTLQVSELEQVPLEVAGTAVDSMQRPVSGATLYLIAINRKGDKLLGKVTSDKNGRFDFGSVTLPTIRLFGNSMPASGIFQIVWSAPKFACSWSPAITLKSAARPATARRAGESELAFWRDDPIDLTIELTAPAEVTGRFLNSAGKPIPGVRLQVYRCNSLKSDDKLTPQLALSSLVPELLRDQVCAISDAEGRFRFGAIPADAHCGLVFEHDGLGRGSFAVATSANEADLPPRTFSSAQMPIDITLQEPHSVTVLVQASETQLPVRGASVSATTGDFVQRSASGVADENGNLILSLSPGKHSVRVQPAGKSAGDLITASQTFLLDESARRQLTISLPSGCVVLFRVRDAATGAGIPGVRIWYTPEGQRSRREVQTQFWKIDNPTTDRNGELRAVFKPGKIRAGVKFGAETGNYLRQGLEQTGIELDLEIGNEASVEFSLQKR